MYMIVRPRGMVLVSKLHMGLVRSCHQRCAIGYFVLLSLVQRHALVFLCKSGETRESSMHFFAHESEADSVNNA